ncbi:MAG: hypothetical protein ACOYXY_21710 [Thermodesulfobacteriota bacterium]
METPHIRGLYSEVIRRWPSYSRQREPVRPRLVGVADGTHGEP